MRNSVSRPIQRGIGNGQSSPPPRSAWGFIKKILNDWSFDFSSLLAYNFIISLLPIAVTAFGIFGLIFRDNAAARQSIIDSIVSSLPDNNTKTAVSQITGIAATQLGSDAGGITAIGIVFAIYGGSRLFISIEKTLSIIYRAPGRSFLYQNLVAIGMLLLFILLMIIIFATSGAPSFLINILPNQGGAQFGIFAAGIITSVPVAFILFLLIYKIVPNKEIKFKSIWCGALIAAILLDIFVVLFPLYIRRFMGSFLGLIGFAVILILFFYYFSLILILGAQINAYFFERIQSLPEGIDTFLSQSVAKWVRTTTVPVFNYNQYGRPRPRPRRR